MEVDVYLPAGMLSTSVKGNYQAYVDVEVKDFVDGNEQRWPKVGTDTLKLHPLKTILPARRVIGVWMICKLSIVQVKICVRYDY